MNAQDMAKALRGLADRLESHGFTGGRFLLDLNIHEVHDRQTLAKCAAFMGSPSAHDNSGTYWLKSAEHNGEVGVYAFYKPGLLAGTETKVVQVSRPTQADIAALIAEGRA